MTGLRSPQAVVVGAKVESVHLIPAAQGVPRGGGSLAQSLAQSLAGAALESPRSRNPRDLCAQY